nr:hypothetical protein [Tanacetum cinerariifolium]
MLSSDATFSMEMFPFGHCPERNGNVSSKINEDGGDELDNVKTGGGLLKYCECSYNNHMTRNMCDRKTNSVFIEEKNVFVEEKRMFLSKKKNVSSKKKNILSKRKNVFVEEKRMLPSKRKNVPSKRKNVFVEEKRMFSSKRKGCFRRSEKEGVLIHVVKSLE